MKKKSLLILPVLLLALAACNKEDEVEVPEDDTPEVTDPSGDQGEDDGTQNPPAVVIDERVKVATKAVEVEDNGNNVNFENPTDLKIASVVEDEESGDITYYLEGTAGVMTAEQATVFWNGVAKADDKFVAITISLEADETASWTASDSQEKIAEPSSEDIVIRITGEQVSESKHAGTATYTITDAAGEEVNHIVDFSALIPGIALKTGDATVSSDVTYSNPAEGLSMSSGEKGVDGSVTYTVTGTPSTMCPGQAADFGGSATTGTKYIVLLITFRADQSVSWHANASNPESELKTRTISDYPNCEFGMTVAIYDEGSETVPFTITDADGSVDYVVDVSALMNTTTGGDTGNDEP